VDRGRKAEEETEGRDTGERQLREMEGKRNRGKGTWTIGSGDLEKIVELVH
jgi:hypothetical protein